jgi:ABC-2 type transport system permease protein
MNENRKKNFIGSIKDSFSGRKFRSGAYVTATSAVVIAIVIIINMIVTQMGLQVDLTSRKLYTLSDETKDYVKNIKEDITIYLLAETGNENTDFQRIAKEYEKQSGHIHFVHKDPILYPKFASEYTDKEISQNSFIVVNDETGRSKYLDYSDLVVTEFDYNTYQPNVTGYEVEGEMTSAIQFVTNPDLPKMYVIEGHGEQEIGEAFKSSMDRLNVQMDTLEILKTESVPEDCDILFINTPTKDFSEEEVDRIKDYMMAGGNAIITLDYTSEELKNFKSLLDYYGMEVTDGILIEGDSNMHLPNYPNFLVPEVVKHDITDQVIDNKVYAISPVASGLTISDTTRSSLTVSPLLQTSDTAYAKQNIYAETMSKEKGDIEGPFYIGLLASDTYNGVTSNMAVFSAKMMFDESMIQGYGNGNLLSGTIGYMSGDKSPISIASKSILADRIYVTQQQGILWGALVILVLPVFILVTGIAVNLKRRKR